MVDNNYSDWHVAFVSGHNGTTVGEISLVAACGPVGVLMRNMAVPWLFPAKNFSTGSKWEKWLKLLLDFLITVVPMVLCFTIFSDRIITVLLVQGVTSMLLLLFCLCEYAYLYREKPAVRDVLEERVDSQRPYFITYARAYALIGTSIGILAVDFPVFPRRFAKTETVGYGLMDVGVGTIVVLNGILGPEISRSKQRISRLILKCFPLVAMGLARLLMVKLTGYHEVVSEYGVHWNFFFTLAAAKIISSLLSSFLPMASCSGLLSCATGLGYQLLLSHFDIKSVIVQGLAQSSSRDGIFDANREGLISVLGYLSLYFGGLQLGAAFRKRRGRLKHWFYLLGQCVAWTAVSGCLLVVSEIFLEPPSRRMANLTYILWIMFLVLQQLSLFLLVEILQLFGSAMKWPLFSYSDVPFQQLEPCLLNRINRRALFHFVVANLLTGGINMVMRTIEADDSVSIFVLLLYSYLLSVIVFVF